MMNRSDAGGKSRITARSAGIRPIVFPRNGRWEYLSQDSLTVSTFGIPAVFRRAFLRILSASDVCYRRIFGARSLGWIEFNAVKSDAEAVGLWTNGADRVFLKISREEQLYPPTHGGACHVYGLPHELAHIVLYRSLVNLSQLPEGWGEGWAHYLASFIAVPQLYAQFGTSLWPYPYNYMETEGPARCLRQFTGVKLRRRDPVVAAAERLHKLEQRKGRSEFARFFRNLFAKPLLANQLERLILRELNGKS